MISRNSWRPSLAMWGSTRPRSCGGWPCPGWCVSQPRGYFEGPPEHWVEELVHLVRDLRFSVVLADPPPSDRYSFMAFPSQIVPALRAELGLSRATRRAVRRPEGRASPAPERAGSWGAAGGLEVGARPVAPPIDRSRFTPMGEQNARWLASLHEHLREELRAVRSTAEAVATGELTALGGRVALHQAAVARRRNDVARECVVFARELEGHHGSEDAALFPAVARAEPSLTPVVQRLAAEHRVIADRLDALDRVLVRILRDPEGADAAAAVAELQEMVAAFEPLLDSHLAYEEDQLGDGLRLIPTVL